MREKSKYAGCTVKIKENAGDGLSGREFVVEDWCENVLGCSWMDANGNPTALEYAVRLVIFGKNNNVPMFSNDVLYGKVAGMGYLLHVNELELNTIRRCGEWIYTEEKQS